MRKFALYAFTYFYFTDLEWGSFFIVCNLLVARLGSLTESFPGGDPGSQT